MLMAGDSYHCLDMPYNGQAPDGALDYIHFLKVRIPGNGVDATDIANDDVRLLSLSTRRRLVASIQPQLGLFRTLTARPQRRATIRASLMRVAM